MSSRTRENAELAEAAYRDLSPGNEIFAAKQKYRVLAVRSDESGYYGAILQKVGTAELVVVHRGTETSLPQLLKDGGTDASMVLLELNPQSDEARELTRQAVAIADDLRKRGHRPEIRTVGHSLGGCHAQMMAVEFGLEAETFNAYGAVGLLTRPPRPGAHIVNHVRATDAVAAANGHVGEVRVYATPEDVRRMLPAGYVRGNLALDRSPLRVASVEAHGIANFTSGGLLDAANIERYALNREVFDQYRADVHSIRMSFTQALDFYADGMRRQVQRETLDAKARVHMNLLPPGAMRNVPLFNDASNPAGGIPALEAAPRPSEHVRPSSQPADVRPIADVRRDPTHPDHALYRQIYEATQRMCERHGFRPTPEQMENTALSLTVAVRRDPLLHRVDEVVPSHGGPDGAIGERLFAVYKPFGDKPPFFHAHVDAASAARTPAEQSIERLHALEPHAHAAQLRESQERAQAVSMRGV